MIAFSRLKKFLISLKRVDVRIMRFHARCKKCDSDNTHILNATHDVCCDCGEEMVLPSYAKSVFIQKMSPEAARALTRSLAVKWATGCMFEVTKNVNLEHLYQLILMNPHIDFNATSLKPESRTISVGFVGRCVTTQQYEDLCNYVDKLISSDHVKKHLISPYTYV